MTNDEEGDVCPCTSCRGEDTKCQEPTDWLSALRAQTVVAPDSDSITRFAPYVMLSPIRFYALLDIAEAVGEYVNLDDGWSAWNNQNGHGWPGIREALAVLGRA